MKKVISMILVLAMAAALFCTPAFADYVYTGKESKTTLIDNWVLDEEGSIVPDDGDIVVEPVDPEKELDGIDDGDEEIIQQSDVKVAVKEGFDILKDFMENGLELEEGESIPLLLKNLLLNDPSAANIDELKLSEEQIDYLENLDENNLYALLLRDFYSKTGKKPITLGVEVPGTEEENLLVFYRPPQDEEAESAAETESKGETEDVITADSELSEEEETTEWTLVWFGHGSEFKVQFPDKGTFIIMIDVKDAE